MIQIQKLVMLSPEDLTPNRWNTNVVSPEGEQKLEASIERVGMFKPVLVRELNDGTLEILGGQHRSEAARRMGIETIPVINLGKVSDDRAKEISLLDNGRYGSDDALQLAELLESLGGISELSSFMPFSDSEFDSIFSSVNIALDDLDLPDSDDIITPKEKPIQTHSIMRFKVPVDDVEGITKLIEQVIKTQKFTESDSLENAGDALVHLLLKELAN